VYFIFLYPKNRFEIMKPYISKQLKISPLLWIPLWILGATLGIHAQSPGGVSSGLTVWFKANNGAGTSDGSAVSTWTNQVPAATYHLTQPTAANQPKYYSTTAAKLVNFNPAVDFDGSNDYIRNTTTLMSSTTPYTFLSVGIDEAADVGYRSLFSSQEFVDYFSLYKQGGAAADNGWTPYSIGGISDRGKFGKGTKYSIAGGANGFWNGTNFTSNATTDVAQPQIIGMNSDNTRSSTTNARNGFNSWLDGYKDTPGWAPTDELNATYQSRFFKALAIGADMGTNDIAFEFWKGRIPELIAYNRQLSDAEMAQVNSYLAIKYGVTLGQGNGFVGVNGNNYNYVNSSGVPVWTAAANAGYNNTIFGIGRDDASGLIQKQSKSVNTNSLITIGIGTGISATNAINGNTFTSDASYELIGDNGLSTGYITAYLPQVYVSPVPSAFKLMSRTWKVQETGTVGTVTVSVPADTKAEVLLVSNSATFTPGSATEITLTPDGNGNLTAQVNLTDGQYFTFGATLVAPGGVVADMQMWLKADKDVVTTGAAVTQWSDQSMESHNLVQATGTYQPLLQAASTDFNYNPSIKFDGANDRLEYKLGRFMSTTSSGTFMSTASNAANGGYENLGDLGIDNPHMGTLDNQQIMWMNSSAPVRIDFPTTLTANKSTVLGYFWNGGSPNVGSGLRQNGTEFYDATTEATAVGNGGPVDGMFTLGSYEGVENWTGNIAEAVLYSRNLTTQEKDRVDTYMSIKYGTTLSHNYLSAAGTTIYDVSGAYSSNIAGIGRDNAQGLLQKQSRSINTGFQAAIALGSNIAVSNVLNTGTIANDAGFMVWGSSTGTTSYSSLITSPNVNTRMARVWKVKKTNWTDQSVTIHINDPQAQYLLIQNSDPTFATITQEIALTNGAATINSSLLPDGAYFTFARQIFPPGGVATNLNFWIIGEEGSLTGGVPPTDGQQIEKVLDKANGGEAFNDVVDDRPTYQSEAGDQLNFHHTMRFGSNGAYWKTTTDVDKDKFDNFAVFTVFKAPPASFGNSSLWGNADGSFQRFSLVNGTKRTWCSPCTDFLNVVTPGNWYIASDMVDNTGAANATQFFTSGKFSGQVTNTSGLSSAPLYIARRGLITDFFYGDMTEVIVYGIKAGATPVMAAAQRKSIESYLAIKYGITLDQSSPQDYLASDQTTKMWDAAANGAYKFDITGIGRDDFGNLNQKQSKSVNADNLITIGVGSAIAADNESNAGIIANDKSFLTWANNDASAAFSVLLTGGTSTLRLGRVWKADKTNWSDQNITLCYAGGGKNRALLISTDPTFTTFTQELPLNANGCVTFNSNLLSDGVYFTIGGVLSGPGCVNADLQLWLKADEGVNTAFGTDIESWFDQSLNGYHPETVNQPFRVSSGSNFNPVVRFDGTDDYFKWTTFSNSWTAGEVFYMLKSNRATNVSNGFAAWGNNHWQHYTWADQLIYDAFGSTVRRTFNPSWDIQQYGIYQTMAKAGQWTAWHNGNQEFNAAGNTVRFNEAATNLGFGNLTYFSGDIGEVILYNRELTAAEKQRVNSYLGVKYGLTLPHDYLSGTGTTIYPIAGYNKNIAGIGRDDCQSLIQKQSKSSNTGALLMMGIDNLIATDNATHSGAFDTNASFLMWGDNGVAGTLALPAESPTQCGPPPSADKRLGAIWKVVETGTVESAKLTIDLSGAGFSADYPVYMLVSSDAAFTSYNSILLTGAGANSYTANFNFDGTKYITFAGNTTPPANLCEGNKTLSWWPYTWPWTTKTKNYDIGDQRIAVTVTDPSSVGYLFNWYPVSYGRSLYIPRYDNNEAAKITTKFQLLDVATPANKKPASGVSFTIYRVDGWWWGKDVVNVYGKLNGVTVSPKLSRAKYTDIALNSATQATGNIYWRGWTQWGKLYVNFDTPVDEIYVEYSKDNQYSFKVFNDIAIGDLSITCKPPVPEVATPDNVYLFKEVSPNPGLTEEAFTYKFTIQNLNCDDQTINLNDVLPSGLTWVDSSLATSLTVGTTNGYGGTNTLALGNITVPKGTSYIYMDAISATTGTFTNQASFVINGNTYLSDEPSIPGADSPTPITIDQNAPLADISIVKTVDKATTDQNTEITYTYKITNNEASPVKIILQDNLQQKAQYVAASMTGVPGGALVSAYANESSFTIRDLDVPGAGAETVITVKANVKDTGIDSTLYNFATYTPDGSTSYRQVEIVSNTVSTKITAPPAPGGVTPSLALWMKANAGLTTGATLTWLDQSPNSLTATQATAAAQPTLSSNAVNFNPSLVFANNVNNFLTISAPALPTGNISYSVFGVAKASILTGGAFAYNYLYVEGADAGNQRVSVGRFNGVMANANYTNDLNSGTITTNTPLLMRYTRNSSGGARTNVLNGLQVGTDVNASLNKTNVAGYPRIGNTTAGAGEEAWDGDISEIIVYNSVLSATQYQQVESYLALKYGITLNQNTPTNYLASNGSTIWDASAHSGYKADIAGIGQDDASGLAQKQSKSVNASSLVTVGLGTIATDNATNSNTFAADKNFLIWGDNGGASAWQSTESPANRQRLTREWKVQETGTVGSVKLQVPNNGSALTTKLPAELTTVYLLTDADGDFSSGATETVMTLVGTNWEADIDLTDGQFFTFATQVPCNAGTNAPVVSAGISINICPLVTVNLNALVTSPTPANTTLVWFTNNAHTGTAYASPTLATANTYYAFYFDATNNCYSPASIAVVVTINVCLDLDGDGIIDLLDPDDDGDGLSDAQDPKPLDTDNDGTNNTTDPDDDGDGIADDSEAPGQVLDTDNDGAGNEADTDDDNDSILDSVEQGTLVGGVYTLPDTDGDGLPDLADALDTDGDGIADNVDTDDDGDGLTDATDPKPLDTDNDGTPNATDTDDDGDGILDAAEASGQALDTDNDGTPNATDTDDDNDGILDSAEIGVLDSTGKYTLPDGDGDGLPDLADALDLDVDNDGIPNATDPDMDGDGINNIYDTDVDGDGIPNATDTDDDGDGILDANDTAQPNDADGFGTPGNNDGDATADASDFDLDGDGTLNDADLDTDNDGIPNATDTDDDGDGTPDAADTTPQGPVATDTDGDGIPDATDTDDDNDGLSDATDKFPLDTDNDGTPNATDTDDDGDGILDAAEASGQALDTDNDGTPNATDTDDDNDGILDSAEIGVLDGTGKYTLPDSDGDGLPDLADALDTDGDGIADNVDTDDDGDGLTDTTDPKPLDTDNDGTPNATDTDDDGDGILDAAEVAGQALDTDNDGTPNVTDTDDDIDGILDSAEIGVLDGTGKYTLPDSDGDGLPDLADALDTDGDGIPDATDTDDDNDGLTDTTDKFPLDTDNDGTPNATDTDDDGDGILDTAEASGQALDTDNDGTPNVTDTDDDNDGILDSAEIGVLDGTGKYTLPDSDGDGLPDLADALDTDGDGIPDATDTDDDNDGLSDATDKFSLDTDNDGTPNATDTDDDGDGILDTAEASGQALDTDNDGTPNVTDTDDDNDGILDSAEIGVLDGTGKYTLPDSDGDGLPDLADALDLDGDGIPDATDMDDDNDGLTDTTDKFPLDTDNDGTLNATDTDDDGDGILDTAEASGQALDTDNDGTPNATDTDDDGDGILDSAEIGLIGPDGFYTLPDGDGDGLPDLADALDLDVDNDGIPNATDPDMDGDGINNIYDTDVDGDGIPNATDTDDDGDGILDGADTAQPNDADGFGTPGNNDGDATADASDFDLDGDGTLNDADLDTDNDGIPNATDTDDDGDGTPDAADTTPQGPVATDTDGDGIPDATDTDDDNDGLSDATDKFPLDTDNDGTPNATDTDDDGDGILDAAEASGQALDTDNDGTPNVTDTDDDNDGILDSAEIGVLDGTGKYTLPDSDGDGLPDLADALDTDGDGIPDATDTDDDNDGLSDATDKFPLDTDNDGTPNATDTDDDGDGILDAAEASGQALDTDNDGTPNVTDTDDDNDGILDSAEIGVLDGTGKYTLPDSDGDGIPDLADALDTDGDGIPDTTDADDDGDGISDAQDSKPLDSDNDGIPNAADTDDDGDGILDVNEQPGKALDTDNDGTPNATDTDDDNDGILDTAEQGTLVGGFYVLPDSDGDGLPDLVDSVNNSVCVTLNLKVLLEGPYDASTGKMSTMLNQRGLLPGQTHVGPFGVDTPAGQPYTVAPWNYNGTEGKPSITYASTVVDWVLVSLRTDSLLATSTVLRKAALLHDDGHITFTDACTNLPTGNYFVVIEHRNHMGVMSGRVNVQSNTVSFDFTQQDSYIIANPPSFGQTQVNGKWMMHAGDGKKDTFTDNYDINFNDSQLWKNESGFFDKYLYGDFNMDADVNFLDSVIWKKNNGRYSVVPR
jgi:hypothetical protein